jgi:hypothetical protein
MMHRSRILAAVVVLIALAQLAIVARSRTAAMTRARDVAAGAAMSRALGLTDLAIWTEARYTRHPSLADRATAFQDHPGSLEHFPAGSVVAPPPQLLSPSPAAVPRP